MKKGMATVWTVLITVVVMAAIGYGGYYFLNTKYQKDNADLKSQISDLTTQKNDLQKSIAATTATPTATTGTATAASAYLYSNSTYGFSMTFNSKWQGYRLKEADISGMTKAYYVCVPTTDKNWAAATSTSFAGTASIFALGIYTPDQWEAVLAAGGPTDTKITENTKYVFGWSGAQALPTDLQASKISSDISNIISTFKLL